jgi:predicted XRE-type DNA-binding protein
MVVKTPVKDPILAELETIKKLLVLGMLKNRTASQKEIAGTLGISQPTVSKMFPNTINFRTSGSKKE